MPGVIQSGTYKVKNSSSEGFATVKSDNFDSPVISSSSADSEFILWSITKLPNNNYKLLTYLYQTPAAVGLNPSPGNAIKTKAGNPFEWTIKEIASNKGNYLISPSGEDLYWSLENSTEGTPVKLTASDTQAKWSFERIVT